MFTHLIRRVSSSLRAKSRHPRQLPYTDCVFGERRAHRQAGFGCTRHSDGDARHEELCWTSPLAMAWSSHGQPPGDIASTVDPDGRDLPRRLRSVCGGASGPFNIRTRSPAHHRPRSALRKSKDAGTRERRQTLSGKRAPAPDHFFYSKPRSSGRASRSDHLSGNLVSDDHTSRKVLIR